MYSKEAVLSELGLTTKEVRVYLTLLALGQSTVTSIAKKSNLNRITCYDIIKHLEENGLVGYVIKSGVRYFEAADPQKLLGDLQEKQQKLKLVLPELDALKKSVKEKPTLELYEGLAGIKTVMENILKENKESWFIADPVFIDALQFYFPHFITKKRKQGMYSKLITLDCKRMRTYKKKSPRKYIDVRFIGESLPTTKIIYGNKVAMLTFEKENSIGVILENKQTSDTERKLFGLLWKTAKQ